MDKKSSGLTSKEAQDRLLKYGANFVEEEKRNKVLLFLQKFWAPVPWMLEVAIGLQLTIGKYDEASIIAVLLLFNALLSFFQEERSNRALTILKN
ncbi:MAG TPA: cation-transporting P-type ATPase, partial [Alphaproteobacteria bacterium]|nr:cation-transporting P-type ATPase [Alphaproteobacteria bacterium]